MRPNAFTCAVAITLGALVAACGKDPDRDMAKEISRAAPPPQPTTGAQANSNARTNPGQTERREGRNPQQGQVDPKQGEQRKDFEQDTKPRS